MNDNLARFSTSEDALEKPNASNKYDAKQKILKLRQLKFRHCEAIILNMNACTWPCSITEMDGKTA
jgi:hypothetical protein